MSVLKNKKTLAGQIVVVVALVILAFLSLFPFWLMIIKSFKTFMQEVEYPLGLTFPFAWDNYALAWEELSGSIFNSVFVAAAEVLLTLVLSAAGAFAFSRFNFRGKTVIYSAFLSVMMIPGVLTLTTKYVMVASSFGLYGSYWGIILPQAAGLTPFGILLLKGFFDGIPKDLFEAAELDGAGSIKQFFNVSVPLGIPIIVTLVMLGNLADKYTIPVMLNTFTSDYYKTELYYGAPLAGSVIVSAPILVLFAFTSKQFISGMTSGALKM